MKTGTAKAPVLRLPNFNHSFVVKMDGSHVAIGTILIQILANIGGLWPTLEERCINQKCAIQHTKEGSCGFIGHWKQYFRGPHPITIQTNHVPHRHLPNQPPFDRKIWKCLSILQGYDVDIQHIPGKRNLVDLMSLNLLPMHWRRRFRFTTQTKPMCNSCVLRATTWGWYKYSRNAGSINTSFKRQSERSDIQGK